MVQHRVAMYIFRIYVYHITSLCIWFLGNILVHTLSEVHPNSDYIVIKYKIHLGITEIC